MSRSVPTRRLPAVGLALLALAVAGCGGSATTNDGAAQSATDPFVIDVSGGTSTLDPAAACGDPDVAFAGNFYARLTKYGTRPGPDGTTEIDPETIEPDFATAWEVTNGDKTYTFDLHSGATFPSGEPMDAKAVKYSLERVLKTPSCAGFNIQAGRIDPPLIESIKAPSADTLVIELSSPEPEFLQGLAQPAGGIVDPSVVEANGGVKEGELNEYMASHVAGSGPYLLESFSPNSRAVLVANPDFFGDPPAEEDLVVNFIGDNSTLLLRARSQEADVTIGLTKQAAESLQDDPCCRVIANATAEPTELTMPNGNPPFDDVKFREALTYAIPYDEVLANVAHGFGEPYYGPLLPLLPGFNAELSAPRPFDLERARGLVAESGVETPVDVSLIINAAQPLDEQLATIVQSAWKPLGVDVKIRKLSTSDFTSRYTAGDYQAAINTDGPNVISARYYLDLTAFCKGMFNAGGVCVPGVDPLLAELRTTPIDERQPLLDEITRRWVDHSPKVQFYADRAVTVLNQGVERYHFSHTTDYSRWARG